MSDDQERPVVHGYESDGSSWVVVDGERTSPPALAEFLLARIAEDEEVARSGVDRTYQGFNSWQLHNQLNTYAFGQPGPVIASRARILAECDAKRRILELHRSWPVMVESPPALSSSDGLGEMTFRVTQQIAWITQQEYRERFGDEPPTTPMLRALALPYADHPDFDESWRP